MTSSGIRRGTALITRVLLSLSLCLCLALLLTLPSSAQQRVEASFRSTSVVKKTPSGDRQLAAAQITADDTLTGVSAEIVLPGQPGPISASIGTIPKGIVLAVLRNASREECRHRHVSPPREQCKGVFHQRPYRASPTMEDLRRPGVPSRPGVCGLLPLHAARRARDGAGNGARLLPQDRLLGLQRSVPLDGRDERADDEVHQRTVSRDSPRTRTANPGRTHHPGRPPQLRLHGDDGIRVDGAAASTPPTGTSSTCSTSRHRRPP